MNIMLPILTFISKEITEILEKKIQQKLTKNFNEQGIYTLFDLLLIFEKTFMRILITEIFEKLDEKIFLIERDKDNFIVHGKRIRHIETIFGDIAFYRRYYFDKKIQNIFMSLPLCRYFILNFKWILYNKKIFWD